MKVGRICPSLPGPAVELLTSVGRWRQAHTAIRKVFVKLPTYTQHKGKCGEGPKYLEKFIWKKEFLPQTKTLDFVSETFYPLGKPGKHSFIKTSGLHCLRGLSEHIPSGFFKPCSGTLGMQESFQLPLTEPK